MMLNGVGCGGSEKLSDFGCILKAEAMGFASGLHLRYEKEKNQYDFDGFQPEHLQECICR